MQKLAFFVLFCFFSNLIFGQIKTVKKPPVDAPQKKTTPIKPSAPAAPKASGKYTLKIRTNEDCNVYIDGQFKFLLKVDELKKISLSKGEFDIAAKPVNTEDFNNFHELIYVTDEKLETEDIYGIILVEADAKRIAREEQERQEQAKKDEEAYQYRIKSEEESAWNNAKYLNSISSYQNYLDGNTLRTNAAEARELIAKLKLSEDEDAWRRTKEANYITSYENYINGYTLKNHLNEAISIHKDGLINLGTKSAAINDLKQMESYFNTYFRLYPNGADISKAKKTMCDAYFRAGVIAAKEKTLASQNTAINYFYSSKNLCPLDNNVDSYLNKALRKVKQYERPNRSFMSYCWDEISPIGLSFGGLKTRKIGVYLTPRCNVGIFTNGTYFTVKNDGSLNGNVYDDIRFTNVVRKANVELNFGLTKKIFYPLWLYAGIGGAYNTTYWKMDTYDDYGVYYKTNWVRNTDLTYWSPVFESGLIFDIKGFNLRVGAKTADEDWFVTAGIGFSFTK